MTQDTTLQGWKAIAGYLGRDERTALRWASQRGLPVRRVPGSQRGPVFASTAEIDAWLQAESDLPAAVEPGEPPAVMPPAPAAPEPGRDPDPRADRPAPAPPKRKLTASRLALASVAVVFVAAVAWLFFARVAASGPATRTHYADRDAKAAYLQATFDWNLRTRESLARALQEYGDAIAHEPGVPDGYVGLANTYLLIRQYGSLSDAEAYARASAAARAALALGPASADLHRALAVLAVWQAGNRPTARREFALARAMRPDDPLTHQWLATALSANGEAAAALREIDVARELNPASTAVLTARGILTYLAGNRAEGWTLLRTLERDQPENATLHLLLGRLALFEGRPAEFVAEEREAARLRGDGRQLAAAARFDGLARGGLRPLLAGMLDDAKARVERQGTGWFALAQAEAMAGDRPAAFAALRRSCAAGEMEAITARNDLWLSRGVTAADIGEACGPVESLL